MINMPRNTCKTLKHTKDLHSLVINYIKQRKYCNVDITLYTRQVLPEHSSQACVPVSRSVCPPVWRA